MLPVPKILLEVFLKTLCHLIFSSIEINANNELSSPEVSQMGYFSMLMNITVVFICLMKQF